jgi:hypothetical protein
MIGHTLLIFVEALRLRRCAGEGARAPSIKGLVRT